MAPDHPENVVLSLDQSFIDQNLIHYPMMFPTRCKNRHYDLSFMITTKVYIRIRGREKHV
jgi:hypothetical protein